MLTPTWMRVKQMIRIFEKLNVSIDNCLVDRARMGSSFEELVELKAFYASLYQGNAQSGLGDFAPYLVRCRRGSGISRWIFENGWGKSWGIFVQSGAPVQDLRKHFRKFLLVATEDGDEMYFRFYDPRVLRVYLPTCYSNELKEFFGPVQKYIVEDEDPSFALIFSLYGNMLQTNRIDLREAPPAVPAPAPVSVPAPIVEMEEESTIV